MGRQKTVTKIARDPKRAREFAQRLRTLMSRHGIRTSIELAKSVGTTPGVVGYWLSGERTPTLPEHIWRLSEIFGVTSDYLLFGRTTLPPQATERVEKEVVGVLRKFWPWK